MFLHHAYLIEGREEAVASVHLFILEKLGITLSGNPDFTYVTHESFGVDESRGLKETASRTPIGERKIILIRSNVFTREAQNALLKLFEEPTPNTHFFVITPYPRALLPTLRSRMEIFDVGGERGEREESPEMSLAKKARASEPRERMAIAGALHDEENKQKSVRFLEALTEILDAEMRKKRTKEVAHSFSAVSRAASYARDIGASMKTLLEYAVLSLPE